LAGTIDFRDANGVTAAVGFREGCLVAAMDHQELKMRTTVPRPGQHGEPSTPRQLARALRGRGTATLEGLGLRGSKIPDRAQGISLLA
jgi:hypothetical protein